MIYLGIALIFGLATMILLPFLYQLININKNMDKQIRVLIQLVRIIQQVKG